MTRRSKSTRIVLASLLIFGLGTGCRTNSNTPRFDTTQPTNELVAFGHDRLGEVEQVTYVDPVDVPASRPLTRLSELPSVYRMLTLDEAISIALNDTKVLRSLSANIVQNAAAASTSFDPALQATDPNFGVEAALAAFDTNLTSSIIYANNDDTFNNQTATGGAVEVQQDLTTFNLGLSKLSAAGTQFSINNIITHDSSDNAALLFPSAWNTSWEATVRHPLLQGNGVLLNRIVGPSAAPGVRGGNGFLISRSNQQISVLEFERSIRTMVLEIVSAYWQLDLAYRNFLAVKAARDGSYKRWQIAIARRENGLPGGEADSESQARAQFYLFQSQLSQTLNSTQANGGAGVLQAEANLRRLLNLPLSDGELLKPADAPTAAVSVLNWDSLFDQAMNGRIEIEQQKARVEQSSLLLLASRSFVLPRLDAIATYRNSGFGDDLIGDGSQFSGALNEAWQGNFDEWEFGFAFDVPIGNRQARAGVKNAELALSREHAVLRELSSQIVHNLGSAFREVQQFAETVELADLRSEANQETVLSREAAFEADTVAFQDLLDAQQQLLDAQLQAHQVRADYEVAVAQLFSESGSLLEEYQIFLNEAPEPSCANGRCVKQRRFNNVLNDPSTVQRGTIKPLVEN